MNTAVKIYCKLRHALESHEGIRYVVSLLLNGTIILSFYHLLAYFVISLLPVSYYFQYYSVEPFKTEYTNGEKITMVSNAEFYKPVFVEWRDILHCPPIGYYSVAITAKHKDKSNLINTQWLYNAETPKTQSECYIESQITATVSYGIKKTQIILSQPFTIK